MWIQSHFSLFWERNPALFLGFSLLLGTAASFQSPWLFSSIAILLLLSFNRRGLQIIAIVFFLFGFFTTNLRYPPLKLESPIKGTGQLHIKTLKVLSSAFHKSLAAHGSLNFISEDFQTFNQLPCNLYLPLNSLDPKESCDYEIQGVLEQKANNFFVLKPSKNTRWKPIKNTHSFAKWRYETKQKLARHIKKSIQDRSSATLLAALATGNIDERLIALEFNKVGLQHILAISGFHFALIALFLHLFFRLFFPFYVSHALLLSAVSFYYFFLGDTPSIQRAYLAIAFVIIGKFFSLKISGLNALGMGLLIEISLNPLVVAELGFQLTFLCSLAILLLYSPFDTFLKRIFPSRTKSQLHHLNLFERHGYLLSSLIRKALAVNFAVTLLSLPVLLHVFHKFPLLSLIYNLFFPACICLSLLLLCIALLLGFICTPLSVFIHSINTTWTSSLLIVTSNAPTALDFVIRSNKISFYSVIWFLTVAIFAVIFFQERQRAIKSLFI